VSVDLSRSKRPGLLSRDLKNGIASTEEANKEFVEKISETITCGVLVKLLADQPSIATRPQRRGRVWPPDR
jgi:hypothetical protein